jgi:hypothetical protein
VLQARTSLLIHMKAFLSMGLRLGQSVSTINRGPGLNRALSINDKCPPTSIVSVAIGPVIAIEQVPAAISICDFLIWSAPHVDELISVMAGPTLQGKVAIWATGCR